MKLSFEELLAVLESGQAARTDLYGLSNLDRAQAEQAWAVCTGLSDDARYQMIQELADIAADDFEVNFGELFRLALEDESADVRRMAVEGLWEDEDVRLVPQLAARLLEDPSAAVRSAAAESLGRFVLLGELGKIRDRPYSQAFQALLAAYDVADSVEVQRRILESLSYASDEVVPGLIEAAYRHADERMRVSAVFAMGRNGDDRWGPDVMRELVSPNPEMRYEAARACGEIEFKDAVESLIELVEDVDVQVQRASLWALSQIGGDEARQALLACSHSNDTLIYDVAREALREFEFLHGDLSALLFDFLEDQEEGDNLE